MAPLPEKGKMGRETVMATEEVLEEPAVEAATMVIPLVTLLAQTQKMKVLA